MLVLWYYWICAHLEYLSHRYESYNQYIFADTPLTCNTYDYYDLPDRIVPPMAPPLFALRRLISPPPVELLSLVYQGDCRIASLAFKRVSAHSQTTPAHLFIRHLLDLIDDHNRFRLSNCHQMTNALFIFRNSGWWFLSISRVWCGSLGGRKSSR